MKLNILKAVLMAMVIYCGVASAGDSTSSFINPLPGASSVLASTCDGTMTSVKMTAAVYNGNLGGVAGGTAKCVAEFPGYHMCAWTEYTAQLRIGCMPPANTYVNNQSWLDYSAYNPNSCYRWTTSSSSYSGYTLFGGTSWGCGNSEWCNVTHPVACCK